MNNVTECFFQIYAKGTSDLFNYTKKCLIGLVV